MKVIDSCLLILYVRLTNFLTEGNSFSVGLLGFPGIQSSVNTDFMTLFPDLIL